MTHNVLNITSQLTPEAQQAYGNLTKRKQHAVHKLQALADRCVDDERQFAVVLVLWERLVGTHANDMQCGMVMHAIHTRDAHQLLESFAIIQGTWKPHAPAKPVMCEQCHGPVKPGSPLCQYCKRGKQPPQTKHARRNP